jgi:hypothetical protein
MDLLAIDRMTVINDHHAVAFLDEFDSLQTVLTREYYVLPLCNNHIPPHSFALHDHTYIR